MARLTPSTATFSPSPTPLLRQSVVRAGKMRVKFSSSTATLGSRAAFPESTASSSSVTISSGNHCFSVLVGVVPPNTVFCRSALVLPMRLREGRGAGDSDDGGLIHHADFSHNPYESDRKSRNHAAMLLALPETHVDVVLLYLACRKTPAHPSTELDRTSHSNDSARSSLPAAAAAQKPSSRSPPYSKHRLKALANANGGNTSNAAGYGSSSRPPP
mmetsp:Transcript_52997/g.106249  ORF Transcript_52997/g.106249 Transcript_52997/m.106249 type:complete len:216 (+) Transcript_52997:686-1333(+)